jgi:16S rRNA (guanine527-N7)-methyltransferase
VEQVTKEWSDVLQNRFPFAKDSLVRYSHLLFFENKKYNLTGLKSVRDIWTTLVIKSLEPLLDLNVPRGTRFIDFGSGSGIPGIVISICFPEFLGVLVDANNKKTDFMKMIVRELNLQNVEIYNSRIEELIREKGFKEKFDLCFTRAFGPLYYSIELGLPMLSKEGLLYIYSNLSSDDLSGDISQHILKLGGGVIGNSNHSEYGFGVNGLLFKKVRNSTEDFPRRFSVIKREAAKISEVK